MRAIIVFSIPLFLLVVIALQSMGFVWKNEELLKIVQPADVNYKSYDPYEVRVVKQHLLLSSNNIIMISKTVEPSYGHAVNYPNNVMDLEQDVKKLKVDWDSLGVKITFSYGQELFVPKKCFTGGR